MATRLLTNNIKTRAYRLFIFFLIFVVVLYIFNALFLSRSQAAVVTNIKDTATRLAVSTASNHDIVFTAPGNTAFGQTITYTFDADFDMTALVIGDVTFKVNGTTQTVAGANGASTWGYGRSGQVITLTAPSSGTTLPVTGNVVELILGNTHIINPATPSVAPEHQIFVGGNAGYTGATEVPILDSDQVTVTGYIDEYVLFDIDTTTNSSTDCTATTCLLYSGGSAAGNYTVDLGELLTSTVRKSGDAGVLHADSGTGDVNTIYFDIETNALNGVAITQASTNGNLRKDGSNNIAGVTDGGTITAASDLYGTKTVYNGAPITGSASLGTVTENSNCTVAGATYCAPSPAAALFSSTGPVAKRLGVGVAASPNAGDSAGNYTDTLTYIATATF